MENNETLNDEPLDRLGRFLMENLRDKGIGWCDVLLASRCKAPALLELQKALALLDEEQQRLVRRCVVSCIDHATHDFLFKLHERADFQNDIQVLVDGIHVEKLTEAGLHYELYGEGGWEALYSRYGEATQED